MTPLSARSSARLAEIREAVLMGLDALRAYKMRASLTILGVVMGIMTVTGMSSIVAGLNASMAAQIEGFGSGVVFIRPFGPGENLSAEERRRRKGLNETEIAAIAERCPSVAAIAPLGPVDQQALLESPGVNELVVRLAEMAGEAAALLAYRLSG